MPTATLKRIDDSIAAKADRSRYRKMRGARRKIRLGNYDTPDRLSIAVDRLIGDAIPPQTLADDAALVPLVTASDPGLVVDYDGLRKLMNAHHDDINWHNLPKSAPGVVFDPERNHTPKRERPTADDIAALRMAFCF